MDIDNLTDNSGSLVSDSGYSSADEDEHLVDTNNDAVLSFQRLLTLLDENIQRLEARLLDWFEDRDNDGW